MLKLLEVRHHQPQWRCHLQHEHQQLGTIDLRVSCVQASTTSSTTMTSTSTWTSTGDKRLESLLCAIPADTLHFFLQNYEDAERSAEQCGNHNPHQTTRYTSYGTCTIPVLLESNIIPVHSFLRYHSNLHGFWGPRNSCCCLDVKLFFLPNDISSRTHPVSVLITSMHLTRDTNYVVTNYCCDPEQNQLLIANWPK